MFCCFGCKHHLNFLLPTANKHINFNNCCFVTDHPNCYRIFLYFQQSSVRYFQLNKLCHLLSSVSLRPASFFSKVSVILAETPSHLIWSPNYFSDLEDPNLCSSIMIGLFSASFKYFVLHSYHHELGLACVGPELLGV